MFEEVWMIRLREGLTFPKRGRMRAGEENANSRSAIVLLNSPCQDELKYAPQMDPWVLIFSPSHRGDGFETCGVCLRRQLRERVAMLESQASPVHDVEWQCFLVLRLI